ncbi:MAG: hypothetical protein F2657_06700 [Actinobacteria bacterium]|uniref:Unannotated protein n=1 Tax=freshwater metagenome TaxID=449393 RepID=A0A6J6RI51_9ZZZZ|nr:hypothetical protein [Actinomycetota bacterium]MSY04541.1 hypothetical protein [Actinomycetota bacterium]MSY67992.1 hypothetical protein [Actinomycetota bacterium]MSZ59339.1 hypothetical protein [Actinomycetota bacterium]MTA01196.1 hypothetical protein [Actinomycetota bacterium]
MRKNSIALFVLIFSIVAVPLNALQVKSAFASGTATGGNWAIDYPDFAQTLIDKKWSFTLKGINGNMIGSGDYAEFNLLDANGKELVNDSGYSSGVNGTIEFWDYIRGSDFVGIDLTRDFKGTVKVLREFGSKQKDAVVSITIPASSFPKRPTTSSGYISIVTKFELIPFPQECTDTEFQFNVMDPYSEISTVLFSIVDSAGKEVATATQYGLENGLQKDGIQLCAYSLAGTVAPYNFVTTVSFESKTGKLALSEKTAFPLASKKNEAIAKANSMGEYCAKGNTSKTVAAGATCPSGYKKINFLVPDDVAWNTLTRMPKTQKNKNYIVYACVAQFDANTGGSKFRGYASPVQEQSYFSNGINAIFTGSSKSLLKLSEKSAFIAKVTVTGGVTYTTIGGKTSVPAFEIRQFKNIGSC